MFLSSKQRICPYPRFDCASTSIPSWHPWPQRRSRSPPRLAPRTPRSLRCLPPRLPYRSRRRRSRPPRLSAFRCFCVSPRPRCCRWLRTQKWSWRCCSFRRTEGARRQANTIKKKKIMLRFTQKARKSLEISASKREKWFNEKHGSKPPIFPRKHAQGPTLDSGRRNKKLSLERYLRFLFIGHFVGFSRS